MIAQFIVNNYHHLLSMIIIIMFSIMHSSFPMSVELIVDVQPTSTVTDYYSMSLLHLIHTGLEAQICHVALVFAHGRV